MSVQLGDVALSCVTIHDDRSDGVKLPEDVKRYSKNKFLL